MIVKPRRKDGKYPVTLTYDNGVKLNKIFTQQQVEETKVKCDNIYGYR